MLLLAFTSLSRLTRALLGATVFLGALVVVFIFAMTDRLSLLTSDEILPFVPFSALYFSLPLCPAWFPFGLPRRDILNFLLTVRPVLMEAVIGCGGVELSKSHLDRAES